MQHGSVRIKRISSSGRTVNRKGRSEKETATKAGQAQRYRIAVFAMLRRNGRLAKVGGVTIRGDGAVEARRVALLDISITSRSRALNIG